MRRNLDPMLFADREFGAILPVDGPDQQSSAASFIELTTQIG